MARHFVLSRTAGVEVSDSQFVGRAEPANGPAIYDRCLEEIDGFVVRAALLVP